MSGSDEASDALFDDNYGAQTDEITVDERNQ